MHGGLARLLTSKQLPEQLPAAWTAAARRVNPLIPLVRRWKRPGGLSGLQIRFPVCHAGLRSVTQEDGVVRSPLSRSPLVLSSTQSHRFHTPNGYKFGYSSAATHPRLESGRDGTIHYGEQPPDSMSEIRAHLGTRPDPTPPRNPFPEAFSSQVPRGGLGSPPSPPPPP
jgi:hypothetical protein